MRTPNKALPIFTILALGLLISGCGMGPKPSDLTLPQARAGFTTNLLVKKKSPDPLPTPPAGQFELVHYAAPLGSFPAYISTPPAQAAKRPAIIWIAGGFDNSIGDTPWAEATPDNDQSARAFWQAGIVTMYPSLRGGNNNPGYVECLYGEVDDILAAAKFLVAQPNVDPNRIYLGGHSTGGTLALLVAESTNEFRSVFAFGPVSGVSSYGTDNLPFDYNDQQEIYLRAPILYMRAIKNPTFVFEGTGEPSNIAPLRKLSAACTNPLIHFYEVAGATHFSTLAPITPVIAKHILQDTLPEPNISFTPDELVVPAATR